MRVEASWCCLVRAVAVLRWVFRVEEFGRGFIFACGFLEDGMEINEAASSVSGSLSSSELQNNDEQKIGFFLVRIRTHRRLVNRCV